MRLITIILISISVGLLACQPKGTPHRSKKCNTCPTFSSKSLTNQKVA